jgi:DNA processing protein
MIAGTDMSAVDEITAICYALKEYARVGPKLFQQLMMTFGHPLSLLEKQSEEIASMVGIDREKAELIVALKDSLPEAAENINHLADLGMSAISYFSDNYPESLRKIADPPLILYAKGDVKLLRQTGVALVGTTAADQAGIRASVDLAQELIRHNLTIISGLAAGIDAAAHLGCLKYGGKTIAVLGCGLLNVYPEENIPLARLISESGAIVSEYDIHAGALPRQLVLRNRIIAALAEIVIVIQIGNNKRGELYAARAAINQGKSVFVYDPDDQYDPETLLDNHAIKIRGLEEIHEVLKYIVN